MNAWIEFFIILGKIFFILIVIILTAIMLHCVNKWMDKPEPKQIQPKVYGIYDSKGRLIERRLR